MGGMLAGVFGQGWSTGTNAIRDLRDLDAQKWDQNQRIPLANEEYNKLKTQIGGLYQPNIDKANRLSDQYQTNADLSLGNLSNWLGLGGGGVGGGAQSMLGGAGGGGGGGGGMMSGFAGGFNTNVPEISRDWRGMTEQDIGTSTGDRNAELARLKQRYGDVEGQYMNTENYLNTASGPEAAAAQRQLNEQIQQIQNHPNMTSDQKQRAIMQARQAASSGFLTQRQGANAQRLQSLVGLRQNQEAQGQDYMNQLLAQRESGRTALGQEDTRNMSAREASLQARTQQAQMQNQWAMQKLAQLQDLYKTQAGFGLDYYKTGADQSNQYANNLSGLYSPWTNSQRATNQLGKSQLSDSNAGSTKDVSSLAGMMG